MCSAARLSPRLGMYTTLAVILPSAACSLSLLSSAGASAGASAAPSAAPLLMRRPRRPSCCCSANSTAAATSAQRHVRSIAIRLFGSAFTVHRSQEPARYDSRD